MPKVKYARPPIQEAICEVHFVSRNPLDQAQLGRIKPLWQTEYPNQQMVTQQTVELRLSVEKVDTQSRQVGHKLITRSEDGKNLAQLGSKFMAVNRLNPYLGWEESFRGTIESRVREVVQVYGFDRIERIGLRYINKIDFPENPLRWSDWLAIALPVPGTLGQAGGSFQFHFEQTLAPNIQGIINFLSLPAPPGSGTSVILDIDVIWGGDEPCGQVCAVLDTVHKPHHDLFESYLLDRTRELFQIQP